MKPNAKLSKVLCLALFACAGLTAIVEALAVLFSYSPEKNYFEAGAILPILATILAIGGVLCAAALALTTHSAAVHPTPLQNRNLLPLSALGYLATAIILPTMGPEERVPLTMLTSLCLVVAAIHSLLSARFSMRQDHPTLLACLGMVSLLGCIFTTAYYYFDVKVEMNAPLKVAIQLGLITAMLAYTGEIRYYLGKPMPRMGLFLSGITIALGAPAMLAIPTAVFTDKLPRIDYAAGAVLVLLLALRQAVRIISLLSQPQETIPQNAAPKATEKDGEDLT